ETWLHWINSPESIVDTDHADQGNHVGSADVHAVKLSPQARANLGLIVKPLATQTYWRMIEVPGLIVDRPAQSDRGIVAPVTGVVTGVYLFPGDTVKPGDRLFTLRLLSETLHLTQSELFKTAKEMEITREQQKRLSGLAAAGAVQESKLIEIE